MRTFAPIMHFSQSALFFNLSFQFTILHSLLSVCIQFHHLVYARPLSRFPWGLLLNTWPALLSLPVLLTRPFQFDLLWPVKYF
jgi:hypothetical protein